MKNVAKPKINVRKEDRLHFFAELKLWPFSLSQSLERHTDVQYLIWKSLQYLNGVVLFKSKAAFLRFDTAILSTLNYAVLI